MTDEKVQAIKTPHDYARAVTWLEPASAEEMNRLEAEVARLRAAQGECEWSRADDDTDMWETSCKQAFQFFDGGPPDNSFKFCCYCGKLLTVAPTEAQ